MPEPYKTIVILFLGWCIGALITHLLAKDRERRRDQETKEHSATMAKDGRQRDFRVVIASLRDNILASGNGGLVVAHKASLPRFREECNQVESDISNLQDFKLARDQYISLTASDIECPDKSAKRPKPYDARGNYCPGNILDWKPPNRYELGRAKIKNLLDAMIDFAK